MESQRVSLGKAQGAVIKFLKSLPADVSWNNVKAVLRQQFSPVSPVTHAATQSINRYQQKGKS